MAYDRLRPVADLRRSGQAYPGSNAEAIMKPKVGIGITTYEPVLDASFGEALFDAYAATSSKITPHQVAVSSAKYPISSAADFATHWLTLTPFELRAHRGRGEVLERGHFRVGGEWRTRGQLSGGGRVSFASDKDPHGSHEVVVEHNFSAGIEWVQLFRSLVATFKPSHAMLHVFTERELASVDPRERFAFNGPIAGEAHFTTWLSPLGDWRRPDNFRLNERRRYRFLPELAWANVLGQEFEGRYDAAGLASEAAKFELVDGVAYLQVTNQFDDVVSKASEFEDARARLKASFADDVFRK
jgi:hypothetical protein